ncbi:MAG TPA: SLBB domain-containing protein [Polyangiales bacterium]|nr:SLBB domain-containing protein [Polyangiales bacterium]
MRRCTAILLSITLFTACAHNRYTPAPTSPGDDPAFSPPEPIMARGLESDPAEPLMLLPGDVIQLTTVSAKTQVYEGLIVDALGQLHIPLAGDIDVGGKTLSEAEKAVERGLQRYDRFARANLIIIRPEGHTAVVVGAVVRPGRVQVTPGMRLADLLAESGGPERAVSRDIPTLVGNLELARLMRDGKALPVSVPLARAGDPKHNIRIRAGDQLFVPPVTDQLIMVLGDVNAPQPVAFRTGIRLTEALARAGGINTARGDRKDVRIVRGPLREPQIYTTNLKELLSGDRTDVELAPGDIVYVTKSWYASTADVLNALSPIISLANSFAILAVAGAITTR